MSKVILSGYIIVADEDLAAVKDALVIHTELTLAEPGCLVFKVESDELSNNRFNVYEEFVDQTAFDAHQARVKLSEWAKITKHVERHYQLH